MDILKEADDLVNAILKMTKDLKFTGQKEQEEADVEAYAELMEARDPLISKLLELKKGVDAAMTATPEFEAIKKTITDITDLDKTHLAYIKDMYDMVQASHKEVKSGQRIHNAYVDLQPESTSRRFDATQ